MADLINRYDLCVMISDASEKFLKEGKGDVYMTLCDVLRWVEQMPSASNWHTDTPTEEGWYLLKLNHAGRTIYDANYLWDIGFGMEWKYAYLGEIVKWQKIEENEDGRTD